MHNLNLGECTRTSFSSIEWLYTEKSVPQFGLFCGKNRKMEKSWPPNFASTLTFNLIVVWFERRRPIISSRRLLQGLLNWFDVVPLFGRSEQRGWLERIIYHIIFSSTHVQMYWVRVRHFYGSGIFSTC